MKLAIPTGPFCQSCAMPMAKDSDFGTNLDSSKNTDYCKYCYQNGAFTEPNITLSQMLTKVTNIMQQKHIPAFFVKKAQEFIPTLKRWRY
jgi:hypothetical protein